MKHKSPDSEHQTTPRAGSVRGGKSSQRAPDPLAGRRYSTGAAMRGTGDGDGGGLDAGPVTPADNLQEAATSLHERHGARIRASGAAVGIPETAAAAVILTESQSLARADSRMPVRFEPYAFFQETGRWLVDTHKDQDAEYAAFQNACAVDPDAALRSLRMGAAQVAGREAEAAGFDGPQAMFTRLSESADAQLDALFTLVGNDAALQQALAGEKWQDVASLRAGPGYGAVGYDSALESWAEAYGRAATRAAAPAHGGEDDEDAEDADKPRRKRPRSRKS